MTVSVSSVSSSVVSSGGRTQVEVLGAGFRQQSAPATSGPVPVPPPSVRVSFVAPGSTTPVEALRVRVASPTRILVTTPEMEPGVAAMIVENIDDLGARLEVVTVPNAIEFARPDLRKNDSDLLRVIRALIRMLKRQVIPEVVLTRAIDWKTFDDSFGVDSTRELTPARVPALWLTGPTLRASDGVNAQTTPVYTTGAGGLVESRTPRTVDLVFGYSVLADSFVVCSNLVQAATNFAIRNRRMRVDRDPNDASAGSIEFDLELEADFVFDSAPNDDVLYSAAATITIKAVDILGAPGIADDLAVDVHPEVDEIGLEFEQFPAIE